MTREDDLFVQLTEDFGLEILIEQNDLEEWEVVKILFNQGYLDINDYIFKELDVSDED